MLRKAHRPAPAASHDSAPASRLSYYASLLPGKESQFQTPEGYRIYKDVPICRTGSQQYLGREIKNNPGYKAEWGIGDDELVTVYRPIEEVTAPETIASFEGKSVLDEHPADPKILVDALDEYESTSKGHAQNVRVGKNLADGEFAGETPLLADLHVKHPDLNVKVDDGVRDVSCGYTFRLDKDSSGRYIQRQIRGNHVAIVPKGRAGADVGIKDAAPKLKIGRITMSIRSLFALGLQAALKDAKPDEVAGIVDAALEEEKGKKGATDAEAHIKGCKCDDCAGGNDRGKKAAKDADFGQLRRIVDEWLEEEGKEPDHKGVADRFRGFINKKGGKDAAEYGEDEITDADKLEEEEKKDKKEEKKEAAEDADALILPADEHSRSEFSTGDAIKHVLALKPVIAACKDKGAKDSYAALCKGLRQVKTGVKDSATDPFALLTRITSADGAADQEPEIPMFQFFNGKSHADGLKAYNEYLDRRAARARK